MGMDISLLFQIAGIGFLVAIITGVLNQSDQKEYAKWVSLIGFIIIFLIVTAKLSDLFQKIKSVFLFH